MKLKILSNFAIVLSCVLYSCSSIIKKTTIMKQVIIPRGIQASGKSTFSKSWVAENQEKRVRINMDDLRRESGPYWVPPREKYIVACKWFQLKKALEMGYSVVMDNMNMSEKEIKDILKRVEACAEVEFKEFFTPVDECVRRDGERADSVGEKIIRDAWDKRKCSISKTYHKYLGLLELDNVNRSLILMWSAVILCSTFLYICFCLYCVNAM